MINLGLITKFNDIKSVALPTLLLARHISPILGTIMSIIMILVIYNTIVGLMYAFASRFTTPFSKQYFILIIVMTIVTFICTFIGFISLIGKVFPIMGLLALFYSFLFYIKGLDILNMQKKVQREDINLLLNLLFYRLNLILYGNNRYGGVVNDESTIY